MVTLLSPIHLYPPCNFFLQIYGIFWNFWPTWDWRPSYEKSLITHCGNDVIMLFQCHGVTVQQLKYFRTIVNVIIWLFSIIFKGQIWVPWLTKWPTVHRYLRTYFWLTIKRSRSHQVQGQWHQISQQGHLLSFCNIIHNLNTSTWCFWNETWRYHKSSTLMTKIWRWKHNDLSSKYTVIQVLFSFMQWQLRHTLLCVYVEYLYVHLTVSL